MPPPNVGMLFTPPLKDGKGVKAGVKEAGSPFGNPTLSRKLSRSSSPLTWLCNQRRFVV